MPEKIKLVPITPESLAQQERDIAANPKTIFRVFPKKWLEKGVLETEDERDARVAKLKASEPEYSHAKAFAAELTHENLATMSLEKLKNLWANLWEALKADGCTGFHATPNTEEFDKMSSDEERERQWHIGVMGMLGASFRGENEDITESLL